MLLEHKHRIPATRHQNMDLNIKLKHKHASGTDDIPPKKSKRQVHMNGITNGIANGHSNGMTNGYTNGISHCR